MPRIQYTTLNIELSTFIRLNRMYRRREFASVKSMLDHDYRNGGTVRKLARKYQVCPNTIWRLLKGFGIETRKRGPAPTCH